MDFFNQKLEFWKLLIKMVKFQNIGKPQDLKGYHSVALFSIMIEIRFKI